MLLHFTHQLLMDRTLEIECGMQDLRPWTGGDWFLLPQAEVSLPGVIVGAPGSGDHGPRFVRICLWLWPVQCQQLVSGHDLGRRAMIRAQYPGGSQ